MKPVVVVGPHRSGTSVTTRVVSLLGPSLCIEDDRMAGDGHGAQRDNPRGHWESRSLTELDDELLARFGGTWFAPPDLPTDWAAATGLDAFRGRAVEQFHRVHPHRGWVWKDPRLCLLLPFWIHALEIEPVVVLTVRHPLDIARSLAARDGFGPAHVLAIWESYAAAMLRHCAGLPVIVVRYDQLLDDTHRQVTRLRDALLRFGVAADGDTGAASQAIRAVDASLRHHRRPKGASSSPQLDPAQSTLLRLLSDLDISYDRFPCLELPEPADATVELIGAHQRLDHLDRTAGENSRRIQQLDDDVRSLRARVAPGYRLETIRCRTRTEFQDVQQSDLFHRRYTQEVFIAWRHQEHQAFALPGYCLIDRRPVEFELDWLYAHPTIEVDWLTPNSEEALQVRIPNWRERMLCPHCKMNNRQRAIAALVQQSIHNQRAVSQRAPRLYLTEQVTPMYRFFESQVPGIQCAGSEFLDPELESGTLRDSLRHEDVEALSFDSASLDLVVSCSVLEHVNEPMAAVLELARILRPGGELFLEVPFDIGKDSNTRRARRSNGEIEHLLPAAYHGDPMSSSGALVYFDFGWEFFDQLHQGGLLTWDIVVYWSQELGHLGGAQFFFHGRRTKTPWVPSSPL